MWLKWANRNAWIQAWRKSTLNFFIESGPGFFYLELFQLRQFFFYPGHFFLISPDLLHRRRHKFFEPTSTAARTSRSTATGPSRPSTWTRSSPTTPSRTLTTKPSLGRPVAGLSQIPRPSCSESLMVTAEQLVDRWTISCSGFLGLKEICLVI